MAIVHVQPPFKISKVISYFILEKFKIMPNNNMYRLAVNF